MQKNHTEMMWEYREIEIDMWKNQAIFFLNGLLTP